MKQIENKTREPHWSSSTSLWGPQSACISLLTTVSSVCLLCVGTQACPHCLRPALAEGRTGERAGSPYLAQLLLAAVQQGRSWSRAAPLGKVRKAEGVLTLSQTLRLLVWVCGCVWVKDRFSSICIFIPFYLCFWDVLKTVNITEEEWVDVYLNMYVTSKRMKGSHLNTDIHLSRFISAD